ncbi:MAG: hypothetical protein ACN4G0_13665, partial [Polyangiales bacterium]
LPLVLLLAGCPIYTEGPVQRGVEVSCQSDFDCPSDTFCDPGTNSCLAYDFGVCLTDGDCPVGSYCDLADGGCYIPPVAECRADGDCTSGFECDFRDTCRPAEPDDCLTDSDCLAPDLCIENFCKPVTETCQFDFQCAAGFTCTNNRCRLLCGPQTVCPTGTTCEESLCQPIVGECIDSSDCPDLTTNCVEGTCLRRCDEGCTEATEVCDAESFCRPRTSPDPNAPTPFCRTDADCDGSVCRLGLCRTVCDSAANEPDLACASRDAQVPLCGPDNLCYAESESVSDCRVQSDCIDGDDCVDGKCR